MSDGTKIEWTDATWNVVNGCSVLTPGCTNCYAMRFAGTRLKHHPSRAGLTIDTKAGPVWTGEVRFNDKVLFDPLRWRRARRIFVCAHGDLFHDSVPNEWIDSVFDVMAGAKHHVFQVLTKRPERMRAYINSFALSPLGFLTRNGEEPTSYGGTARDGIMPNDRWPLPNVWLGVSVEDQKRADERIPILLATPAAKRWLSMEPLLGPVDLQMILVDHPAYEGLEAYLDALVGETFDKGATSLDRGARIDWIALGGESGPGARPMHPAWARQTRDQCHAAGVPFLFKQWGEFAPGDHGKSKSDDCRFLGVGGSNLGCDRQAWGQMSDFTMVQRVGKKAAGRMLDGVQHDGFPA